MAPTATDEPTDGGTVSGSASSGSPASVGAVSGTAVSGGHTTAAVTGPEADSEPPAPSGSWFPAPLDLLRMARPQQWVKNFLLYAGFIFSSRTEWSWRVPEDWLPLALMATVGFLIFNALSAGTYYINDAMDVEADRVHPRKRFRPIAAGRVSVRQAWIAGLMLILGGIAVGLAIDFDFGLWAIAYAAMTISYSLLLKHLVIVDVLTISTGFALRAIAGAAIIDVPISPWLYVCTTLGALFIAAMKRQQEVALLTDDAAGHRAVLGEYTTAMLDQMTSVAMSATIVAYALYATTAENLPTNNSMLFTLPWVLYGLFRFRLIADRAPDRNSDELIARDIPLLVAVVGFGLTAMTVLAFDR